MRQNLKQARIKAATTQKETATTIGVSERMYQHIEAGTREGKGRIWDALETLFNTPQQQLRENDTQQNSSTNDINLISKCYRGVSMKRQAMFRLTERAHEWVEEQARKRGISKSDVIQEWINTEITLGEKKLEG